jgi:hypothetical protein
MQIQMQHMAAQMQQQMAHMQQMAAAAHMQQMAQQQAVAAAGTMPGTMPFGGDFANPAGGYAAAAGYYGVGGMPSYDAGGVPGMPPGAPYFPPYTGPF